MGWCKCPLGDLGSVFRVLVAGRLALPAQPGDRRPWLRWWAPWTCSILACVCVAGVLLLFLSPKVMVGGRLVVVFRSLPSLQRILAARWLIIMCPGGNYGGNPNSPRALAPWRSMVRFDGCSLRRVLAPSVLQMIGYSCQEHRGKEDGNLTCDVLSVMKVEFASVSFFADVAGASRALSPLA